jgi:hypothetical protein
MKQTKRTQKITPAETITNLQNEIEKNLQVQLQTVLDRRDELYDRISR